MRWIGLDIHRASVEAAELRDGEPTVRRFRFRNTPEAWQRFAASLDRDAAVCLEATGNAFWIYDLLACRAREVVVAHPLKTRAIAEARIKTDKVDAEILARLLKADFVARVWVPPKPVRELRSLLGHWCCLVKQKTVLKNQVHGVLMRQGLRCPFTDLFGRGGRAYLQRMRGQLPETEQIIVDSALQVLDRLQAQLEALRRELYRRAQSVPEVRKLLAIPGVDVFTALLVIAELGEASRFSSPKHVTSYAGLVPSVHQSGSVRYTGSITKAGRRHLRWVLVQAAQKAVRSPGRLQRFYLRLRVKKGHHVAIVAAARKLLTFMWLVLVRDTEYLDGREDLRRVKERRLAREGRSYVCQDFWGSDWTDPAAEEVAVAGA